MRRRAGGVSAAIGLGTAIAAAGACGPTEQPNSSAAPVNACPAFPCAEYQQSPAPSCAPSGTCLTPVVPTGVVLVVSVPTDSAYAPGQQFVVPYEHLSDCYSSTCMCTWPTCGRLPPSATFAGGYVATGNVQSALTGVGFFLGNAVAGTPVPADTLLPVHASFRMLSDPWNEVDVAGLGLPVQPVEAVRSRDTGTSTPGPYGGPPFEYQVSLPIGTYERTITPDAPYDSVFGPSVQPDTVVDGQGFETTAIENYECTTEIPEIPNATLPVFDISRRAGLDGWTAFLRDPTTKQILSNVRPLSGTDSPGVQLVTDPLPQAAVEGPTLCTPDALTNVELVIAPPIGAPYPTAVIPTIGQELPEGEPYPVLPPPVTLTGAVTASDGSPADADLVFEALAFTNTEGVFAYTNFEFVGNASARTAGGSSTYTVTLPAGPYRVDVRPLDTAISMVVTTLTVGPQQPASPPPTAQAENFVLPPALVAHGQALLADGRKLAGATVESLPQACPVPPLLSDSGGEGINVLGTTDGCLPRDGQTVTASDGTFSLPVDPGGYTLRVEPAPGTGFPWTLQRLDVGSAAPTVAPMAVPAPFHASFSLLGADDTVIANALVQAFFVGGSTSGDAQAAEAAEIGEALTDSSGQCDLDLALPP